MGHDKCKSDELDSILCIAYVAAKGTCAIFLCLYICTDDTREIKCILKCSTLEESSETVSYWLYLIAFVSW